MSGFLSIPTKTQKIVRKWKITNFLRLNVRFWLRFQHNFSTADPWKPWKHFNDAVKSWRNLFKIFIGRYWNLALISSLTTAEDNFYKYKSKWQSFQSPLVLLFQDFSSSSLINKRNSEMQKSTRQFQWLSKRFA